MIAFYVLAAIAVMTSILVIAQRNPIYSVLLLIASFGALSGLYVMLDAPFVAVIQIVVYAGAIMVLFLFVIMLLNLGRDSEAAPAGWKLAALGAGGLLGAELAAFFLLRVVPPSAVGALDPGFGSVKALAHALFTDHALSFEITSILLLVAMVGAVVLARRGID